MKYTLGRVLENLQNMLLVILKLSVASIGEAIAPHALRDSRSRPWSSLPAHLGWLFPRARHFPHVGEHREEGVGGERHLSPKPDHPESPIMDRQEARPNWSGSSIAWHEVVRVMLG
jgi:hypothetical protein